MESKKKTLNDVDITWLQARLVEVTIYGHVSSFILVALIGLNQT